MTRRRFLHSTAAVLATALPAAKLAAQAPDNLFDLVIKGGRVIDPSRGVQGTLDIAIRAQQIVAIEADIEARLAKRTLDAGGKLVTPGLIDLNVHADPEASAGGVAPDTLCAQSCVTTLVNTGELAVSRIAAFKRYIAMQSRCRIFTFIDSANPSVSAQSTRGAQPVGTASIDTLARALAEHHALAIGVMVGRSATADALDALRRAIAATERAGTRARVMCSMATVAGDPAALLEQLRPRDILTHVYGAAAASLDEEDKRIAAVIAARRRGVVIDVGQGAEHFDYPFAERAIEQGLVPDVISSGLRRRPASAQSTSALPQVMSQFLNMGFDLEQVIAMATVIPARIIGRDPRLGTLELGAPGDVSILELIDAPVTFADVRKNTRQGKRWLRPVQVIRAGVPIRAIEREGQAPAR